MRKTAPFYSCKTSRGILRAIKMHWKRIFLKDQTRNKKFIVCYFFNVQFWFCFKNHFWLLHAKMFFCINLKVQNISSIQSLVLQKNAIILQQTPLFFSILVLQVSLFSFLTYIKTILFFWISNYSTSFF